MVGRWALRAMAALALGAAAAGAPAQDDQVTRDIPFVVRGAPPIREQTITAAGAPVLLFHYFNLAPDCGPTAASVRLTTAPAHGSVDFQDGAEQPAWRGRSIYPAGDARTGCRDRLVATRDAIYTPAAGFSGADAMVVEVTEAGVSTSAAIDVTVMALDKPAPARR
jgi:hypothetical protein